MTKYDWMFLWVPVLIVATALPMLLGIVPPNGLYGFRTKASMANPQGWYLANRAAAKYLILCSILSVAVYFLCKRFTADPKTQILIGIAAFTILLFGTVITTQIETVRFNRHNPATNVAKSK